MRPAPKPSRLTVRSPPRVKVAGSMVRSLVSRVGLGGRGGPAGEHDEHGIHQRPGLLGVFGSVVPRSRRQRVPGPGLLAESGDLVSSHAAALPGRGDDRGGVELVAGDLWPRGSTWRAHGAR